MKKPPKTTQAIRYIPEYAVLTGSLQAGLLLSQLVYWAEMMKGKPFYKTNAQLANELGMTAQQIRRAKEVLLRQELISIELKGMPKKSFYGVRMNKLCCSPEHNVRVWRTQRMGLENTTYGSGEHTNSIKDNNKRKEGREEGRTAHPSILFLGDFYLAELERLRGMKKTKNKTDDDICRRLLDMRSIEELKPLITKFIEDDDKYLEGKWHLNQFKKRIEDDGKYLYDESKDPSKKLASGQIPSHLQVTQGIY